MQTHFLIDDHPVCVRTRSADFAVWRAAWIRQRNSRQRATGLILSIDLRYGGRVNSIRGKFCLRAHSVRWNNIQCRYYWKRRWHTVRPNKINKYLRTENIVNGIEVRSREFCLRYEKEFFGVFYQIIWILLSAGVALSERIDRSGQPAKWLTKRQVRAKFCEFLILSLTLCAARYHKQYTITNTNNELP